MTVLFIIFGILMIACGFSCMFTPLYTFLRMEYFIVILMLVFGIVGIIKSIAGKRFGVSFVFDILSVILGIVLLVFPGTLLFAESVSLIITAIWIMMMGIVTIFDSIKYTKPLGGGMWILQLIFGILAILLGAYSFFNPLLLAISFGIMIGIFFIETGFTLMFSGAMIKD